jgi:ferritin-like protein
MMRNFGDTCTSSYYYTLSASLGVGEKAAKFYLSADKSELEQHAEICNIDFPKLEVLIICRVNIAV